MLFHQLQSNTVYSTAAFPWGTLFYVYDGASRAFQRCHLVEWQPRCQKGCLPAVILTVVVQEEGLLDYTRWLIIQHPGARYCDMPDALPATPASQNSSFWEWWEVIKGSCFFKALKETRKPSPSAVCKPHIGTWKIAWQVLQSKSRGRFRDVLPWKACLYISVMDGRNALGTVNRISFKRLN